MTIKVLVNGAQGNMGKAVVNAIQNTNDLILVAQTDKEDHLVETIQSSGAQVVVDFTTAESAFVNANAIITAGARPVIGTSGLLAEQVETLTEICRKKQLGGLVAPNFALGAVLMMQYARDCAQYFPDVEIIEMHHTRKADAPSGTALRTAEMISETQGKKELSQTLQVEKFSGARGASYHDIPIHSVRLPGLLAHQIVIFGGLGQSLSIRHDTMSREAFMPGVCLACRKVMQLKELVFGLEKIL